MNIYLLKDKRGVALVTALLMLAISLAIVLGVLYLITRGTSVSSLTRQYHTAHDAAYGGAEFATKEIIEKVISGSLFSNAGLGTYGGRVTYNASPACFNSKLVPTGFLPSPANWDATCANNQSLDLAVNSDFQAVLAGTASQSSFTVYVKIVDSKRGNSDTSGTTLIGNSSNIFSPPHIPYLYRLEVLGQRTNNPSERANLTGLYAY